MAILAYDDVMLREPRLLIPRAVPLGQIVADRTHPLLRGCIGYWPLLDRKGAVARDLIGTSHGVLGNGCILGNEAAVFPSADDDSYIDIGWQSWAATSGSVVIWVKSYQASEANNNVVLINRNESGVNSGDWFLQYTYSTPGPLTGFYLSQASQPDAYTYSAATTMPLDWTQYVCTWTTTSTGLYINGVAQTTTSGDGNTLTASATQTFLIGSFKKTAPYSWFGEIRNVMFYERVLSQREILDLYLDPFQVVTPA